MEQQRGEISGFSFSYEVGDGIQDKLSSESAVIKKIPSKKVSSDNEEDQTWVIELSSPSIGYRAIEGIGS